MIRRIFLVVVAGLTLLTAAGCESTATTKPKRNVTIPLEMGKTRTNVTAKIADLMTLELPPSDVPGHGWQVFMLDARFIKQVTEVTPPATPDARPTVRLLAIGPTQKTTVRFLLIRQDGAKEAQPVDGHDVVFSIE